MGEGHSLQESYGIIESFSRWAHLIDKRHDKLPSRKRRLKGRRNPVILNDHQVAEIIDRMKHACKYRPLGAHHTFYFVCFNHR